MKRVRALLVLSLVGMGSVVSTSAWAAGRHFRGHFWYPGIGIAIGAPWWWYPPGPYYSPYPYPPVAAVPTSPPVYIERGGDQEAPQQSDYWYYCPSKRAYYPYVKDCPEKWQAVAPEPPSHP